ncbi:hypothetical protein [Acinetobacter bereziniae]|uniref:hypothetical protein n=1 Tax=Acinetobacter bereziniae TaxID=106648 RepID=UPI0030093F6D
MEISKEREAFEAEFSKIKSDIAFWLHTWDEEMQGYNHPVMCWFWYMWQAKKQATPEGFVLVPNDTIMSIYDTCDKALDSDIAYRSALLNIKNDVAQYADSIEAQEQRHD